MQAKPLPPHAFLAECFAYNKRTGVVTWRHRPPSHFACDQAYKAWNSKYAGTVAGQDQGSHFNVGTMYEGRKVQMLLHRVIWKLVTGDDPGDALIDHRDCDGYNNRWSNLRLATKAQNSMNRDRPATNSSGVKGVGRFRKKWRATIKLNDRAIHLGSFDTIEEAALVRKRAEATYFGSYRHRA